MTATATLSLPPFKADFGFDAPRRTKKPCKNPVFADHKLHRIAIMKIEHFGHKGDRDESGIPGWTVKLICTGCGRRFKVGGFDAAFIIDKKVLQSKSPNQ